MASIALGCILENLTALGARVCTPKFRKNLGNHAPERPRLCHHYDKFLQVHASGDMLKERG